jgi:hypothetical protein
MYCSDQEQDSSRADVEILGDTRGCEFLRGQTGWGSCRSRNAMQLRAMPETKTFFFFFPIRPACSDVRARPVNEGTRHW